MAQAWESLLFAHWPVSADQLRRVVPAELPLDHHEGKGGGPPTVAIAVAGNMIGASA